MRNILLSIILVFLVASCTQDPVMIEQKGEIVYGLDNSKWQNLLKKQNRENLPKEEAFNNDAVQEIEVKPIVRENVEEEIKVVDQENKVNIIKDSKSLFNWPLYGKVTEDFGDKPGGVKHDGINIEANKGDEVKAARAGQVVYSGNELSGYGNLVILKHDNGWLSAYAHLDKTLVKKNEQVRNGQVIGNVGQTGNVLIPQLHFALRIAGKKPVDPILYLPKRVNFDNTSE